MEPDVRMEAEPLANSEDFGRLASFEHDCDRQDVVLAGTVAPGHEAIVRCRLCSAEFRFERRGDAAQWRLAHDSAGELEQACHIRRARMLEQYCRVRLMLRERLARFDSESA